MDELTHNVSEWGGVSVPTTCRSQHSHGGSRMEWTWRTATESNITEFHPRLKFQNQVICPLPI